MFMAIFRALSIFRNFDIYKAVKDPKTYVMKFHIPWPNGLVVIATFFMAAWNFQTDSYVCIYIQFCLHIVINTNKVSQFPLCRGSISKQSRVAEMHNLSDIRWWSVVSLAIL